MVLITKKWAFVMIILFCKILTISVNIDTNVRKVIKRREDVDTNRETLYNAYLYCQLLGRSARLKHC